MLLLQTWQHNTEMGLLSNVKYERDWANQSNIQIRRIKDVSLNFAYESTFHDKTKSNSIYCTN